MNFVGYFYGHGQGVQLDYAQAMSWYRRSADAGCAMAIFNVGALYHSGLGVVKDSATARIWYRKTAAFDNPNAMAAFGGSYERGDGVSKDYPQRCAGTNARRSWIIRRECWASRECMKMVTACRRIMRRRLRGTRRPPTPAIQSRWKSSAVFISTDTARHRITRSRWSGLEGR